MADLIFDGPGTLQLEDGGKVYEPGDVMPHTLSHARQVALNMAGLRFTWRHDEPVITPEGKPAEMAAAEQIEPAPGSPAIVAAVEDVPTVNEPHEDEQTPRASRKGH